MNISFQPSPAANITRFTPSPAHNAQNNYVDRAAVTVTPSLHFGMALSGKEFHEAETQLISLLSSNAGNKKTIDSASEIKYILGSRGYNLVTLLGLSSDQFSDLEKDGHIDRRSTSCAEIDCLSVEDRITPLLEFAILATESNNSGKKRDRNSRISIGLNKYGYTSLVRALRETGDDAKIVRRNLLNVVNNLNSPARAEEKILARRIINFFLPEQPQAK